MKYWVYKESRILGPFDKEGVSGVPGLDSGTLVCEGDPAGGSWLPAGEISDLSGLARADSGAEFSEYPASGGVLDQLQIDTAGLVGDDDFPGALAEDLFQDSALKSGFGDLFSGGGPSSDAEASRARQKVAELTIQLEQLYRHISQLESGQTELARRLADKELELRRQRGETGPVPEAAAPARTFLSPAPPPPGAPAQTPPAIPAVPAASAGPAAPSDWSQTAGAGGPLPAIFSDAPAPSKLVVPGVPAAPDLPSIPPLAPPPPVLPMAASEAPEIAPPAPPKTLSFGKPKTFKIVPTVKSFKVLGAGDAVPAASPNPVPEFSVPEPVAPPAPEMPALAAPVATPPPPSVPEPAGPPPVPVMLAPSPVPEPMPALEPAPVPMPMPVSPMPVPTPVSPPPNTLSRSQPVPDLTSGDLVGSADATMNVPETLARGRGAAVALDDGAAARFAKPAPPPPTGAAKPPRNNKPFLIGGVVLVILLVIVGVIFMRQPKDDLKQMATLDDGKAPIGIPADDGTSAPPMVKPRPETPAPVAAPVPPPPIVPPGPSPEHLAAIAAVKDFPLDGGRGTVGRWLQYSYTASPGAGTEEWNASTTDDNTELVEYKLVPGAAGGAGVSYLFEVNGIGLVIGKNPEARQMLAGGSPPEAAKPKKKSKAHAKKKTAKRRPAVEEPKEVPLLPLPDSGELRPPAEDDGSFGSDTINSGI